MPPTTAVCTGPQRWQTQFFPKSWEEAGLQTSVAVLVLVLSVDAAGACLIRYASVIAEVDAAPAGA